MKGLDEKLKLIDKLKITLNYLAFLTDGFSFYYESYIHYFFNYDKFVKEIDKLIDIFNQKITIAIKNIYSGKWDHNMFYKPKINRNYFDDYIKSSRTYAIRKSLMIGFKYLDGI